MFLPIGILTIKERLWLNKQLELYPKNKLQYKKFGLTTYLCEKDTPSWRNEAVYATLET